RGRARLHVHDAHVPEPIAGAEHGHAGVRPALALLEHLDVAVQHDVHLVARLAFAKEHVPGGGVHHLQVLGEVLEGRLGQGSEQTDVAELCRGDRRLLDGAGGAIDHYCLSGRRDSQVLVEYDSGARRPGVILDDRPGPTGRLVEGDGAVVARVRDRLETPTPGGARLLLEALVEHLAHTATAIIRVDADQVHVARLGRAWSDEAEQEAHHDAVVLDHAGEAAELVEKDRVRQRAGRPSPPTVDDLHDVVVVLLPERSRNHLPSTIPRRWSGWTPSCIEGPCRRPSSSHLPSSVPTLVTWPRRSPTWSPGAPT